MTNPLKLTPDDKREINQLWDAICVLLELAKDIFEKICPEKQGYTVEKLASEYKNGLPSDPVMRNLNKVNTFLSSVATRLTTISEIYKHDIINDDYIRKHKKCECDSHYSLVVEDLDNNISNYIHVLLRDNIGHEEPSEKETKNPLYLARQNVLNPLTITKIYQLMQDIVPKFKNRLKIDKVIS
jgi:hypothetical protein